MPVRLAALAVLAGALSLYLLTLAPTVTLVDSGELILAAWSLGVPHPPGFPLWVLLAHLATLVPVGEVAVRVHAASALFGAVAAAAVGLAAAELARTTVPAKEDRRKKQKAPPPEAPAPWQGALVAATAGALVACSRALWGYATLAEVYTLNTMMVALVLLAVVRFRAEALAGRRRDGLLLAAAALFGLALGVHHVTVLAWAPGLAYLVWRTLGRGGIRGRDLLWAAGAGLAGLAVYAYLPLAAAREPLLDWGDPDSPGRLFRHVSGWIYQTNLSVSSGQIGQQAGRLLRIVLRQFGPAWLPLWLPLVAAGVSRLGKRDRVALAALVLGGAAGTAYALLYDIAEDTEAYLLPLVVALGLVAGQGAAALLEASRRRGRALLAPAAAAVVVIVAAVGNFPYADRRGDLVAREYVDNALAAMASDGLLLTEEWQLYSPLLYALEVRGERQDVAAIDVNLLRRSWYVEAMRRRYPELLAAAEPEVEAYLGDLRAWEADPGAFARDPQRTARIDRRFQAAVLALARARGASGPVYATQELVVTGSGVASALVAAWQPVPAGILFRLYPDRDYHEPPPLALATRSLSGGSPRTEPDDVVELKVRPAYSGMLANRGLYLAVHGRRDLARQAVEAALALNPADAAAQRLAAQLAAPLGP